MGGSDRPGERHRSCAERARVEAHPSCEHCGEVGATDGLGPGDVQWATDVRFAPRATLRAAPTSAACAGQRYSSVKNASPLRPVTASSTSRWTCRQASGAVQQRRAHQHSARALGGDGTLGVHLHHPVVGDGERLVVLAVRLGPPGEDDVATDVHQPRAAHLRRFGDVATALHDRATIALAVGEVHDRGRPPRADLLDHALALGEHRSPPTAARTAPTRLPPRRC